MGTTKGFLRPTQLRTQESLLFERPIVFSNGKAIILAVNDTKIAIFGGVDRSSGILNDGETLKDGFIIDVANGEV